MYKYNVLELFNHLCVSMSELLSSSLCFWFWSCLKANIYLYDLPYTQWTTLGVLCLLFTWCDNCFGLRKFHCNLSRLKCLVFLTLQDISWVFTYLKSLQHLEYIFFTLQCLLACLSKTYLSLNSFPHCLQFALIISDYTWYDYKGHV